ncbi:MAG: hypothetical protein ACTTG8_09190, partial [Catonella sp.]|uniref:hypothetical protein n=1 Tax=Catonella sp. TaxID=2382125 RepID=UPI003F9FA472
KPTEKTTKGYKLVGWFTGQDLIDDTSDVVDNPKPNGELKSRMAEADNEGFRSGKGADLITLGLDKVTKKKYKGEDTLVVVFLREEKTEGVIDTYNNNDSPGDPEDPSNDKTKQGKKKILKQYWDEIEVYKNGVKTETKYKHVGTYKEDNVVKHVKVTEEPKEYKIIGWFTGRDKKVEKNPKPRTDVATEVSLGIKHGTSAKSKVTLGKDEQIITVVYIRTIRKDTTLQKDETGDYKISESKISIRDGFDSKNRLNRILSNTFVWKSPAIANKKCFDHGGHGHHFFCTKYEHTHTEGPCYYYKTYTSHYYEDEDGKKVKKEKKKKKKVKTCNLYEHTHSNACWDTPCGGWDWKDTSILIGVYNSKGYNYPSVLSAYNQHCPKDTMDYVTPGMAGRESDSDSRGTLSSWKTNHSGFNYKFILYRGKDQLTLCDFKNNSFSPSAKGFLGGLSNNSSYNFKSQNTPRKTRLDKEQYKDAFSADIVGGSLGWGLDQTTVYGPRFGAAGMCADQYSPHRFQDYSKFSANATVNIDVYWANKESPDFDGKIEDYVNSKERHMLSAGQIKFVPYVLMQYQDKQGAFKRVDVLSEYKRTLNPYDYIQ